MANKDPAYTITTGFYPEIAASAKKIKSGKGSGRVMQRHLNVRGFTPNSVQKQEMLSLKNALIAQGSVGGVSSESAILNLVGGHQYSNQVGTTPMFAKTSHDRDSYKYIGGTEEYKLYGDQVWYMHGERKDGALLSEYLSKAGMTGPQFQTVFSNARADMVRAAYKLAEKAFEESWDVAKLETSFKDAGEMVAEEIGFESGSFRYMSVAAAIKEGHKLQASKSSEANIRDMVKVDAKGNIVATYDVTEQLITTVGQHGITKEPDRELVAAIKELDPDNDVQMEGVRQGVIKMFIGQADDYNDVIKHLKKMADPKGKKGDAIKWDDILKKAKKKDKSKASVKDLAKFQRGNPSLVQHPAMSNKMTGNITNLETMSTEESVKNQTSLEYIAHMLGTVTGEMNKNFKQTHKVKEMAGDNVYAVVPMKTGRDLLFMQGVIQQTQLVTGANATIALDFAGRLVVDDNQRAIGREQNHKFMVAKANQGVMQKYRSGYRSHVQTNLRNKGLRPATNVSIPAGDKLEDFLRGVLADVQPNMKKIKAMQSNLKKNKLGLKMDSKGKALKSFSNRENNTMFWALPYIGVMQSQRDASNDK